MPSSTTQTGNFLIAYRLGGSPWQSDLAQAATWTAANSFGAIDLPCDRIEDIKTLAKNGLKVGSVDLSAWGGFQALLSPDSAQRSSAVKAAQATIEKGSAAGAGIFFTLMLPEKPELPRAENFKYMVESYTALVPTLEKCGAKLVVEGWPGPGALCCTPETYRSLFREIPSPVMGVNYDPSHLLRMGIDPLRFLAEFVDRVHHVHGKDTELNSENLYEFGHEQPGTFTEAAPFGGWAWRYTIPGHGVARWTPIFTLLAHAGYRGMVSIELEDMRFNGSEEGEKLGLIKSREYLQGC
jgi:sugar phosphate isomerase/epimerase